jgi:ubiquinone/menaquinone biosynthesis C-methylase UbiE
MTRGASRAWRSDHPWAPLYDFVVENEALARVGWRVAMGSDVRLLYAAAAVIGRLPDGATVLDVPCGGGVALRGVRPGQLVRYLAADISPAMLRRTADSAAARQVADVELLECDVARLPLADGVVDLCASFTGLHCFPDPEAAVHELARVLSPGGVLTGSAFLNDTGRRFDAVRLVGRRMGLLGRSGTRAELVAWCRAAGLTEPVLRTSGALVYFRAVSP